MGGLPQLHKLKIFLGLILLPRNTAATSCDSWLLQCHSSMQGTCCEYFQMIWRSQRSCRWRSTQECCWLSVRQELAVSDKALITGEPALTQGERDSVGEDVLPRRCVKASPGFLLLLRLIPAVFLGNVAESHNFCLSFILCHFACGLLANYWKWVCSSAVTSCVDQPGAWAETKHNSWAEELQKSNSCYTPCHGCHVPFASSSWKRHSGKCCATICF